MEKVLIVDGHSAIHATPWLLDLHRTNTDAGREALVRELSDFQNLTEYYVIIVFDGKGSKVDKQGGSEEEILVIYSRTNQTADTIIERLVAKQGRKHDINVASNDRMVLESCYASNAHVMSIDQLWDTIDLDLHQRTQYHRP